MSCSALGVGQVYALVTHIDGPGIEGYHVEKKYFDAAKQVQEREQMKVKKGQKDRRHVTKRGNFLDDETKMRKIVPGPGQYPITSEWPGESKLKINYPNKQTYVDQIMKSEKKEKKPAPGQYNIIKTMKDIEADKKAMAAKKIHYEDRITYLDGVQHSSNLMPGVGNYNPRERIKTEGSHLKTKPEDWRKKHELSDKKKPPKSPDMRTYKPMPSDFLVFDNLQKAKFNKNFLGKVVRFKTQPEGSGLNPAKYNVIQEWRGKDKKTVARHGIEAVSHHVEHKNVYYN